MSIVRCSHCGTANRVGSNFCNRCGTELRTSDRPQTNPTMPDDQSNPPQSEFGAGGSDITTSENEPTLDEASSDARPQSVSSIELDSQIGQTAEQSSIEDNPELQGHHSTRMVTGIQGLLDPMRISTAGTIENQPDRSQVIPPSLTVSVDQLRRIRQRIADDPTLVEHHLHLPLRTTVRLRLPWLFGLLALAIIVPLLFSFTAPVGEARRWPGVVEAHTAIENLPLNSAVWIFWAYDPATAGELDLVAQPAVAHLMERNAQVHIVTLLPAGLATARRLWSRAAADFRSGATPAPAIWSETFLPGGASALAFLAGASGTALANEAALANQQPKLALVVAAHTEEVQQWLELVQTEVHLPTVAFTGAGADLAARPYLASGQLQGLVSGFDGAAAYHQLREQRFSPIHTARFAKQLIAQNWGHVALIVILILGNLRALWLGEHRQSNHVQHIGHDRDDYEREVSRG